MPLRVWGIRDVHEARRIKTAYSQGFYDATLAAVVLVAVAALATVGLVYFI